MVRWSCHSVYKVMIATKKADGVTSMLGFYYQLLAKVAMFLLYLHIGEFCRNQIQKIENKKCLEESEAKKYRLL